jgi:iron-sulfur cluster assembly protein
LTQLEKHFGWVLDLIFKMITVNNTAILHLENLMEKEGFSKNTHNLRVGVKGGGCSGLSYVMDFDDKIEPTDEVVTLESGLKVVIDKKSVLYLFGTELNYSDGLNGKGFEWINPNASRTCGCGESFAL